MTLFAPQARATLVTPGGVPIVPHSVAARLAREYGDHLRIEWVRGWRPYFGLKKKWGAEDPRWERVNTGEISPDSAFDLETMFPPDCTGESMNAYIDAHYGERNQLSRADAAQEAERIVDSAKSRYVEHREANVGRVVQQGVERYERETPHARRVRAGAEPANPMVSGGLTP